MDRQAAVSSSGATPLSPNDSKVLKFLRMKCRRSGACWCKREYVAQGVDLFRTTTDRCIAKLRREGLISVTGRGLIDEFTVIGLAARMPNEPPAMSTEEAVLKVLRQAALNNGKCSLSRRQIGEAIGRKSDTAYRQVVKLRKRGIVKIITGHQNTYIIAAPSIRSSEPRSALPVKRGRHVGSLKSINQQIVDRWIEAGEKWPVTVQFLDEIAAAVEPKKFAKTVPGTKPHKRLRDRYGAAIRRYRASPGKKNRNFRSATKMILVAAK